jgi:DNA/RNA-binding domain of Phe-tRNA-synthetase-like protein
VEDHLGVSIPECGSDMVVAQNEFDGKVIYGAKRNKSGRKFVFRKSGRKSVQNSA